MKLATITQVTVHDKGESPVFGEGRIDVKMGDEGDPDRGKHRKDDPDTITKMRRGRSA